MNRYFGLHTLEGEWHSLLPRYLLLSDRVKGKRILDIGCGTGIGSSLLLELGAQAVDAIDHRPAVLELARMKHAKPGLDFHVMFWEELDFPDGTFDLALCLDLGSPVTDPSLLSEVRRVLRDGGEYICAIERKNLTGMETLLPRYGYADAGESVDLTTSGERVPQLGELSQHFDEVRAIIQRPLLGYIFDKDPGSDQDLEEIRKVAQAGESGLWAQDSESSDDDSDEAGRWITVDTRLRTKDPDTGSIEIWFCGDEDSAPPPLREIRLPYYGIVERLRQVVQDLQMKQSQQDRMEFDEIIDDDVPRERESTGTFKRQEWDDQPTMIRQRPVEPGDTASPLEAIRREFQTMMAQAQNALSQRDETIRQLASKIEGFEEKLEKQVAPIEKESTGVFERLSAGEASDATKGAEEEAVDDKSAEIEESASDPEPSNSDEQDT